MITKFGSLFAGHVDLENEGFDGTPANDRWLSDERLAEVFPKSEAIAKLMDRTGYDTFWLAEHHFQREGYECIPNILMLALHLCHITKNIKIGCGFNIAPMWHPLRMAEDYATADWLTGGRVIFGVGRGYHTREVEVFGAPLRDQDANRELFEEQVDVIFKSFNERAFSHQGKYYTLPKSYIDLRPVQKPHPPIYFAAFSPASMKRIAIYGDGWLPVVIPPAGMKQMWAGILGMTKEAGRDTGKMELVVRANTRVTDAPLGEGRWTFTGSREEIRGDIAACREIGAAEVAFDPSFENVDGFLDLMEMLRELAT